MGLSASDYLALITAGESVVASALDLKTKIATEMAATDDTALQAALANLQAQNDAKLKEVLAELAPPAKVVPGS